MDTETILTSAAVAAAVTVVLEYAAKPWLEARKERILQAYRTRREVRASIGRVPDLFALFFIEEDHRFRAGGATAAHTSLERLRVGVREEAAFLRRRVPELPYPEGTLSSAFFTAVVLHMSDLEMVLGAGVPDQGMLADTKRMRELCGGLLTHHRLSPVGWKAQIRAGRWLIEFRQRTELPAERVT